MIDFSVAFCNQNLKVVKIGYYRRQTIVVYEIIPVILLIVIFCLLFVYHQTKNKWALLTTFILSVINSTVNMILALRHQELIAAYGIIAIIMIIVIITTYKEIYRVPTQ